MAHESLLTVFVIVTALAVVIQAAILFAMYQALRQLREAVTRIDAGIKEHFHPLLRSLNGVITAAREPLSTIVSNVADISGVLRERTHAADLVAADLLDRFRAQVIRFDELLILLTQKLQRAGDAVERSVLAPAREMSALLAGVRRAVEVFLGRQRRATGERAQHEEQLFI
jgi:methyl-accepting chemotaxis protein